MPNRFDAEWAAFLGLYLAEASPCVARNGRDWDGLLHVSTELKQKGFLLLYNPTHEKMVRTIMLPLYYTGLSEVAYISEKGATRKLYKINRRYEVDFTIELGPKSYSWYVIE